MKRNGPADTARGAHPGTRERILDAAADVLNRKGYAATRLSDIAEVAELQAPTIYYYFASREELIQEVVLAGLRWTMTHVEESLEQLPDSASAMERIMTAVGAHMEVVLRQGRYAAATRTAPQLPPRMREAQLAEQRRYGALWRSLIEAGVDGGEVNPDLDPRAARMLIIGAMNWAPEWWNPDRGPLAELISTAQLLVRNGLARASE